MATRATYQINGKTFYIHWDGYEDGAAVYLWNMHQIDAKSRGDLAAAFLRGNDSAEFTDSHDAHGDTEFRYTIDRDTLTVDKRTGWEDNQFSTVWTGHWWDFINAHPKQIDNFERLIPFKGRPFTRSQLVTYLHAAAKTATDYAEKFPGHFGNIGSMMAEFNRAIEMLADYDRQKGEA